MTAKAVQKYVWGEKKMLLNGYKIHNIKSDCFNSNLIVPIILASDQRVNNYFLSGLCDFLHFGKSEEVYNWTVYHKNILEQDTYKKICGFYWKRHLCEASKRQEFVYNELKQNRPVGACINANLLPWVKYSGVAHHNILIIGAENGRFFCVDNYFSDTMQTVSADIIENPSCDLLAYNPCNSSAVNEKEALEYFLCNIKNQSKAFRIACAEKSYDMFANLSLNDAELPQGYDINRSCIIIDIYNFQCNRKNLSNSLNSLRVSVKSEMITELYMQVCDQAQCIEKFKLYMIKLLLTKSSVVHGRCCDILREIIGIEKSITNILYQM